MPWLRLRKKANELCKFYLEELQLDHPEICYRSSLYVLTKPQASFQQGRDLPRNLFSTMKSVTGDTCPLAQLQKHHCSRSLCCFRSVLVKNNDFTIHVCYSTPEPGRSRATGKVVCGAAGIRDSGVLLCPAVSSSALEVVAVTHLDRGEKALASLEARPRAAPHACSPSDRYCQPSSECSSLDCSGLWLEAGREEPQDRRSCLTSGALLFTQLDSGVP